MNVKKTRLTLLFFILTLTLIVGCSKEEENEEYSTVSNMIVERNKARFTRAAQDASSKKLVDSETPLQDDDVAAIQTERQKLPAITFEENVKIVSESSGKVIGTGIASLDKSGKIVSIRVKNR